MQNYNWAAVIDTVRHAVLNNTKFVGPNAEDYKQDFVLTMTGTDVFHPSETERLLTDALKAIPNQCNYRSITAMVKYREARLTLEQVLEDVLNEMEELVRNYYGNSWNHAPGYVKPEDIEFGYWGSIAFALTPKVLSAAKKAKQMA